MRILIAASFLFTAFIVKAQVTINPCITNKPFTIIVLGSSTAAGAGASHGDSAWVRKYRAALQNINQNNQVINLGVGGFTTYKIMPDSFVNPINRPAIDTTKNITRALSYNPDAIIVNLPSNDRQWPMQEQLANFDSLYNHSWNNGVPLYVCTTQPISGAGAYQAAVKDSIIAKFSPYVLDFFTPLADTNNLILPQYAADAVHLNNAGHNILFNQAFNEDILLEVFDTGTLPDLSVVDILLPQNKCQDSLAQVGVVIVNYGDTVNNPSPAMIQFFSATDTVSRSILIPTGFLPCQLDTFWETVPLHTPNMYLVRAQASNLLDTVLSNNTLEKLCEVFQKPNLTTSNDTLCQSDLADFNLAGVQADTIFWYSNMTDTVPLQSVGSSFSLQKDTSLYAQAVNGNLRFSSELTSSEAGNINFNGNMFNLVATQDVIVDSAAISFHSIGTLPINVYTKQGAYQGSENIPSAWTLLRTDTVIIANQGDYAFVDLSGISIAPNDTQAIYLHLANASEQLIYQSGSSTTIKNSDGLIYLSGIGINYNFGTGIYPFRTITANFYYQYGFNRLGDCATDRLEISKIISKETFSLGADTLMGHMGKLLHSPHPFTNPVWVNAAAQDTLSQTLTYLVDTSQTDVNHIATIICYATDKWGCETSDTIRLTYTPDFSIDDFQHAFLNAFPNPFKGQLILELSSTVKSISIYNVLGQEIMVKNAVAPYEVISTANWTPGVYILQVKTELGVVMKRVVKQ